MLFCTDHYFVTQNFIYTCIFHASDRIAVGRAVLVQALDSSATKTEANQVPWEYIDYITSNFENVIASGGFGTIYRGTDMDANAEVAIKALRSDRMSARDKEDFEKEVLVCFIDMVRILDVVR
jgi:hypothetical protein